MCTIAMELKFLDLAPLLEHHFSSNVAKIQQYSYTAANALNQWNIKLGKKNFFFDNSIVRWRRI